MQKRSFSILASVFLGLGIIALTAFMDPTYRATGPSAASSESPSLQASQKLPVSVSGSGSQDKALASWECVTGWYGEPFDGQPTADGETYDMYAATAAHPTLPLGSIVRVTNLRNHRREIVRINDRGPYVEGRELDVSFQVARDLGFDQSGLAKVRVELLKVPTRPSPDHSADHNQEANGL